MLPDPLIALNYPHGKRLDMGDPMDVHTAAVESLLECVDALVDLIGNDRTMRLLRQCDDALWVAN